jgi:hypothetical protein
LLRRALDLLGRAGHRLRLISPPPGDALVGPDRASVAERLPWEGAEMARLLAGEATEGPVGRAIAEAGTVVAYTRSAALLEPLGRLSRRLLVGDPVPPATGPHASLWLAEPVASLGPALAGAARGDDASSLPPDLVFSPDEQAGAERLLSALAPGFLALHPGSGSATKNWPAERFLTFARQCAKGTPWLLVLGPAEQDSRLWERAAGAIVARNLPLRTLGAVLSRARLFLGNDSGVSHLAAAAGAPTLVLFGPTDPALWSPVGRRVRCLRAADGGSLGTIPVDEVLRAAQELLLR